MTLSEGVHRGHWYRVISGVHKGKEGVCDLETTFRVGVLYRLSHPYLKEPVGRFHAEQLVEINPPQYISQVDPDVQAKMLDTLMGRR